MNRAGRNHFKAELDALGTNSGVAQTLNGPITTLDKLIGNPDHVLLLVRSPEGQAQGFLKYGTKDLFFYDKKGKVHNFLQCICLLDFYVLESCQRRGYGKQMFEAFLDMLHQQANDKRPKSGVVQIDPCTLAYDRPSPKLLAFIAKHYNLQHPDLQPNRYTIFEGFQLPK